MQSFNHDTSNFTIFSVFTEGNHGNGTGNHDNQIINSSLVHDNTTNNHYQTHGNKSTSNETYYPPYYESTTQQFDEKDLIFVNGNIYFLPGYIFREI